MAQLAWVSPESSAYATPSEAISPSQYCSIDLLGGTRRCRRLPAPKWEDLLS